MHRPVLYVAASVLTSALAMASFLVVPPAVADTGQYRDPADSRFAPDLRRITMNHDRRVVVVARHTGTPLSQFTYIRYWIDTRPRDQGPEFYVAVTPNTDGAGLRRTEGWVKRRGAFVRCPGFRAHADYFANDALRLSIPRSCLGTPPRVRIAIRVQEVYADRQFNDWAAGARQFMPWVHR